MAEFVLASASPRRKEILQILNLDFDVIKSEVDESGIDSSLEPSLYVQELALLKGADVAKRLENKIVISADTIVYHDGRVLGKPADKEDAFKMLSSLSGKEHTVYTGICIMRTKDAFTVCEPCATKVKFKKLTPEKIRAYINTGEPMDKAGAYAVQGLGATLIEKIDGDYFNVVGLPLEKTARILEEEFDIDIF